MFKGGQRSTREPSQESTGGKTGNIRELYLEKGIPIPTPGEEEEEEEQDSEHLIVDIDVLSSQQDEEAFEEPAEETDERKEESEAD